MFDVYLKENLDNCPLLTSLYLSDNTISQLENLHKCTRISYLYLQHNRITRMEGLARLRGLVKLYRCVALLTPVTLGIIRSVLSRDWTAWSVSRSCTLSSKPFLRESSYASILGAFVPLLCVGIFYILHYYFRDFSLPDPLTPALAPRAARGRK